MSQIKPIVALALGAAIASAVWAGFTVYKSSPSAPVSKPEIVFEAPKKPILECEDAGQILERADSARCTDKARDVTCYIIRPGGSSTSISCLPNQWLNYPQSIANVNEPIQTEK